MDNNQSDKKNATVLSGPIDWSVLDALNVLQRPGKPDMRRRLLTVYSTTAPITMESIRAAVQACDGQALMQAAHSLKSSSYCIGVMELGKMCSELEQLGKSSSLEDAHSLLRRAESEFDLVMSAILDALERNG